MRFHPSLLLLLLPLLLLLLGAAPANVEPVGGGPLLPCGTTDASSFPELQQAFEFAHGVCCDQLGETCAPSALGLPTTCASAICARAVALVNASCAALLISPAFPVGIGFQPILDTANAACAHAAAAGMADDGPVRGRAAQSCAGRHPRAGHPALTHAHYLCVCVCMCFAASRHCWPWAGR
eukprot:COSAG06_NODE_11090_length_1568_cov_4.834581_2_plen_181_part_00